MQPDGSPAQATGGPYPPFPPDPSKDEQSATSSPTVTQSDKRQVRWRIVFLLEGLEATFPADTDTIENGVDEYSFRTRVVDDFERRLPRTARPQSWIDQDYPPGVTGEFIERIPQEHNRYLAAEIDVLSFSPAGVSAENFVRLPETKVVGGPLAQDASEFGDEFFGLPSAFGHRPKPGRTYLTGWIQFVFDEPVGHTVHFNFRYLGVGTPTTNTWGGGQLFDHERTRCFPMNFLPDLQTPVFNEGTLDLRTGVVDPDSIKVFSVFQTAIVANTDRVNRIGYAFPYMFPMFPPVPPPGQRPPRWNPPPADVSVWADIRFAYDWSGRITHAELRGETIALIGLFPVFNLQPPQGPRLFPPFSFGPDFGFFFSNPTGWLTGTPGGNRFDVPSAPNGTPTDPSVYFHPHINLISRSMREMPPNATAVPCVPVAVARVVSVICGGRLYILGGIEQNGVGGRVQVFDPATNTWSTGPAMPAPVFGAQGAAIGDRIYVMGGWTSGPAGNRQWTGNTQVLDLLTDTWTQGPPMPLPVAEATATAIDGTIYVVSGWCADKTISPKVQIFDSATQTWSYGADASLPAVAASAVALGPRIYVIGGRFMANEISSRTVIYDTRSNDWTVGPDLGIGVIAAVAGLVEGRIFLVGGRERVNGPALRTVQELDLRQQLWRGSLPQPVQTAGSGGGTIGNTLYVVGGRVLAGNDELPGDLTDLTQTFTQISDWTLSETRPVFTSTGVLNAASLVLGSGCLAPGMRAIIVGDRFCQNGADADAALAAIRVMVGESQALVLKVQPDRIDFVIPRDLRVVRGKVKVEVFCTTSMKQAPPVFVAFANTAPGLFSYTFGETQEPAYLDNGPALASNSDGSLNFGYQPTISGSTITLYATGLGCDLGMARPEIWIGIGSMVKARVGAVRPSKAYDGVAEIDVVIPATVGLANNIPVVLRVGTTDSNRVAVTIGKTPDRLNPPVGTDAGLDYVFGPPGRSLIPFRPVREMDIDMKPESAFWRHTRSLER